jgi:hypothetical protein
MPRRTARPAPTREIELPATTRTCPGCDRPLWAAYKSYRVVATLDGLTRFAVQVRRCRNTDCPRHNISLRSESEGAIALPQQEFGLDVIALIGRLRHVEHRSLAEIHAELTRRGVAIRVRSVGSLLGRHDELLALSPSDPARLRRVVAPAGRVILAIDGLQPDVGHEVLWIIRDVLSGEILLARSLLSSCRDDLATLLTEVKTSLQGEGDAPAVPILGVVSDGQHSIRDAVAEALPGVPHQPCQFHYLREAARPIYEADHHAKVLLKKEARGIRPIERQVEGRDDVQAEAVRGYCAAVRSALTDDGRPPLEASGRRLHGRLAEVAASLDRAGSQGAAQGTDPTASDPGQGPGCDRIGLAGGAAGVRLGASGGGDLAEQEGPGCRRGAASLPRPARGDRSASSGGRRPGGSGQTLPRGDAELLARAICDLQHRRVAADQQRPGTALRFASVSRASGEWPQGGVSGDGGAWVGATGRRDGESVAPRGGRGLGAGGSQGLAIATRQLGPPPGDPRLGAPLPP